MTLPELGAVVLLAVAAELGRRLAHPERLPHHRPVARALALLLVLDLALELLHVLVLGPERARLGAAPYADGARIAFHAEQAIRLAFPAIHLGLAGILLLPLAHDDRPLLGAGVVSAWTSLTITVATNYPGLRGAPLLSLYAGVQQGAALLGLALAAGYLGRVARGQTWPSPAQRCVLVLIAGDIGALAGPYLIPAQAPGDWWLAHVINLICYGLLVVEQGRMLCSTPVLTPGERSSSSASLPR